MTQLPPKPATTFEKQVDILRGRGLFIGNDQEAIDLLERLNYYRLRGYYIHLSPNDKFVNGSTLEQIVEIHDFDTRLRIILLKLLLEIEITARTRIAYVLGHAWGPLGYMDPANFNDPAGQYPGLQNHIIEGLNRSRELYINTHNKKYGGKFPLWVAVEVLSFGDLSKLYSLCPVQQKQNISNCYDYLDWVLYENWLHICTILRNECAHNSRLYSRSLPERVKIEKTVDAYLQKLQPGFTVYNNTLFSVLLAIRRISTAQKWNEFYHELKYLLSDYKELIELHRIGFPFKWNLALGEKL